MARRSSSMVDDLMDIAGSLPWWVGMGLAAATFLIFHSLTYSHNPGIRILGLFLQFIVPIALFLGAFSSLTKSLGSADDKIKLSVQKLRPINEKRKMEDKKIENGLYPLWISDRDKELLQREIKVDKWSLGLLRKLEWKRFEEVVAEYFRLGGYKAETTPLGKDGGVDIIVYDKVVQQPFSIVQCKAWNTYKVKLNEVRELLGAVAAHKVKQGIFITTSTFTEDARQFGKKNGLVLIDGEGFLKEIKELSEEAEGRLLEFAIEGDYWIPICPKCGIKMEEKKNRMSGKKFWGCTRFPKCRGVIKMSKQ